MEFSVDSLHKIKIALHIVQAVFIFTAWCIEIGLFTTIDTTIGGGDNWYFALCFLSVPILLYQTLTLHFVRSRRWANAYAFATLDIILCFCWLSAFASVAAWNTAGLCGGSKGCGLSKAMVALGFFLFLFFALTSAISVHGAIYFHREGVLPGSDRMPQNASMIDPHADAFSTAPHGEYGPLGAEIDNDKDEHSDDEHTSHALRAQGSRYDMNLPTSYQSASHSNAGGYDGNASGYDGPDDVGTGVNPGYGTYGGSEASAMSGYGTEATDYAPRLQPVQPGERLQFPAGNYH